MAAPKDIDEYRSGGQQRLVMARSTQQARTIHPWNKSPSAFRYATSPPASGRDDVFALQAIEEVKEGRASFLIGSETEETTLRHVIHAFQLAA
jgi:hypothetical protein